MMMKAALVAAVGAAPVAFGALATANMNGAGNYLIQNPNKLAATQFDTDYATKKGNEFFDVYAGPISTRYGEVFWQGLPAVPLPKDIVARFDKKAIAITGYEVDQVRDRDRRGRRIPPSPVAPNASDGRCPHRAGRPRR